MKLAGYFAGLIAAIVFTPGALAQEGAAGSFYCVQDLPTFEQMDATLEAEGFDKQNPSERVSFFQTLLSNPDAECGYRVAAYTQLIGHLSGIISPGEYYSVLRQALSDPLFSVSEARDIRGLLVSSGVFYSLATARVTEGYEILKGEIELLKTPKPRDREFFALFLAYAGEVELAEDMARSVLLELAQSKNRNPVGRLPNSGPPPGFQSRASFALQALMVIGAYDAVIENHAGIRTAYSTTDMKFMALLSVPEATDPAAALVQLGQTVVAMEEIYSGGYMDPQAAQLYLAAHSLALRAAGKTQDADGLLMVARKRFGENFNPEEVAAEARYILASLRPLADMKASEDAQLVTPVQPNWPWEVEHPAEANCLVRFNISEKGKAINIKATCDDNRFLKSAENAIKRALFHPKKEEGKAVTRYNVVQELDYR